MKYWSITAWLMLGLCASCHKEEPINYNNYPDRLTCKINGKPWEPQGNDGIFGAPYFNVEYYSQTGFLRVFAANDNKHQILYLGVDSLRIGENDFRITHVVWRDGLLPNDACDEFVFDSMHASKLIIEEIDIKHKVLKGHFYFTLVNDCGEKLTFLDGIIDLTPFWYP